MLMTPPGTMLGSRNAIYVGYLSCVHAYSTGSNEVTTGHLVTALLRCPHGNAFGLMHFAGLGSRQFEHLFQGWVLAPYPKGLKLPGASDFNATVRDAVEEAKQSRCAFLGTDHLLLGMLREPKRIGARELIVAGLNYSVAKGLAQLHELKPEEQ